ncbi:mitochondrial inner membrane protein OXA1 isoform X1 [Brassica rapa]|uniref:Uncharacterized protein n=1 Tax=Brassica campestris TaxID=3711 RepID=M4CK02_BRACM|nr:mitochondrial inner membrane protein OXA1 isoform X1 [Brassica rapa]
MASAALRSFSRRKLSPKWFCKTSSSTIPSLVLHHDVKTYNTKPTTFSDSSILLSRSFHRQVFFFEDRKKMTFAQPLGASGVFLCRHISSSSGKPAEESSITLDALGDIVEGLVPEKSVEAAIDGAFENLYFPLNCVQYVINGIHDLTGFNWWIMSIVLTAFLVNGLMSPLSLRIERQVWELKILRMCIQKVRRVMQTCDPKGLAKHKKWEAECTQKFGECYKSYRRLRLIDPFIIISFISGVKKKKRMSLFIMFSLLPTYSLYLSSKQINTMAKKIPGFTDLLTPEHMIQ